MTTNIVTENSIVPIQQKILLRRGGLFLVNNGYDITASASFLTGDTINDVTTTVISQSVTIQGDQSLLITEFANYLSDIAAYGFFTWNMYIDGVRVGPYYGIQDQLGQPNLMRKVGIDILVNSGQTLTVDVVADKSVPAPYKASVSLIGVYGQYDYNRDIE
jgi:hypothetical protein